jgi:serine/threonine-protein kinase
VALKFLPPRLADDSVRRERFFVEVRITRQLSHPNICRVYDIAEIDGRHFLSMEYIDGEDLASLIKRIGHLSNEKALDIARQLATGLAAAHERGVLHRDLKPANIMIDGHGRVRITDFGLAIVAEDEAQTSDIAGTPAYMAPEQLEGKGATVRSDMYSLGLVLYEIYTGKNAFKATTLAELREQKESHTPRALSEIREGIDPVVERVIRRCMERDPNALPSSVAQLALALPGGDPLAAALAAGETASPEMVAASGSKEGLRPAIAWSLLAFIILGTLAILAMNDRIMMHRRIPFEKPPDALAENAREFLQKAGYVEEPADIDYGFKDNTDLLIHIENLDKTANRWEKLDAQAVIFWYRQSPRPLEQHVVAPSTPYNPPLQFPGEVLVELDTEGHLIKLLSVPPQKDPARSGTEAPIDWGIYFDEAGLDLDLWPEVDPQRNPPFYAGTRIACKAHFRIGPALMFRLKRRPIKGRRSALKLSLHGPKLNGQNRNR